MPLSNPNQQHLRATQGFIELGMFVDANAELEEIDPFCRHLPKVLLARLAIYHSLKKWELLAVVAKKLTEWNPKEPGFFVFCKEGSPPAEITNPARSWVNSSFWPNRPNPQNLLNRQIK